MHVHTGGHDNANVPDERECRAEYAKALDTQKTGQEDSDDQSDQAAGARANRLPDRIVDEARE